MRTVMAGVLIFVLGCGKDAPNCKDAVAKAAATVGKAAGADTATLIGTCEQQAWSSDMRQCVADVRDSPDLMACMVKNRPNGDLAGEKKANRRGEVFSKSKEDTAGLMVKDYAYDAYTQWAGSHLTKACPDALSDLNEYVNAKDTLDPWGKNYKMYCGSSLPAGVKGGIAVISMGPDGKEGTEDDIKSWE